MRLAERHREAPEAHYTEGELDLEPPEELALVELDDEAILEEELDNEDLLEEDVDDDILEASLDAVLHDGQDDDEAGDVPGGPVALMTTIRAVSDGTEVTDQDVADQDLDAEDLEDSLDMVLLQRMALLDDDTGADDDGDGGSARGDRALLVQIATDFAEVSEVAPCRADEFVCRTCFLVRRRVQLVDPVAMACSDCAT
jgi:hypothetical protein